MRSNRICFIAVGQEALQDVPVEYVDTLLISVRSIVNKKADDCRGMPLSISYTLSTYSFTPPQTPNVYGIQSAPGVASSTGTGGAAGDLQGLATAPLTGTNSGSGSSSACCEDMATLDAFVLRLTEILTLLESNKEVKTATGRLGLMTDLIVNTFNNIP